MKLLAATALSILLVPGFPGVEQTMRRDGNWEITVSIEMDGAPSRLPPRTTTQCVTKEEAADPRKSMPQGGGAMPTQCTISDHKVDGKRVTWSFKCDAPQPMTGTGEIAYADENAYSGVITYVRDSHTMTMKYSGKRLGDCVKP